MDDRFEELVKQLQEEYSKARKKIAEYMKIIEDKDGVILDLNSKIATLQRNAVPKWLDLKKFKLLRYGDRIFIYRAINLKIKYVSFDGTNVYKLNGQYPLGNIKICIQINPLNDCYESCIALRNGNPFYSFHTRDYICAPIPSKIENNEKLEKVFKTVEDALNTINLKSVFDPPYSIQVDTIAKILEDIGRVAKDNKIPVDYCEKCGYVLPTGMAPCLYCSYFRESEEDEEDEDEE